MRCDKNSVPDIIADIEGWVEEVTLLREIVLSTGLEETIKWGALCNT